MFDTIGQMLAALGLQKYAGTFADNEIDLDALGYLTEADLSELGLPMGPRKKILAAIAKADGDAAVPIRDDPPVPPESILVSAQPQAERRQLTVMFVDLVDSTRLSGLLDPEEMRDVILTYQQAVTGVINGLEGHVAKYMGDGVLAYFGFPVAHEDEAERAVRAGLAIIDAMHGRQAPNAEALTARIGIATGLVVVGDLIGVGAAQEQAVVGDTPNLAARLQGLAAPGQVVLSASTRRLLGSQFELADLGTPVLKGIAEPVPAYAVVAVRAVESRFEARSGTGTDADLGTAVGRDHELSLLLDRWSQAAAGEGQLVVLSGEAGIGKSRLTRGLVEGIAATNPIRVSYQCSPYHADSPLYPAIQQLIRAAGLASSDSDDAKLDKLEHLLARGADDVAAIAPVVAALIGVPGDRRYGALTLTLAQLRVRTLQALVEQVVGLAAEKPVLFIVEDVHWIDPTTQEFLELCLDAVAAARVMILATARPSFADGFGGHPVVTRLALNRLGRAHTAGIVARMTGGKDLPAEVLAEITAKTDGVPLFIEELTKTVLESGMLRDAGAEFVLDRPMEILAIPSSLHDSLMARLDRMQPVKEVAQTAACIGREFTHRQLAATMPPDDDQGDAVLSAALDDLVAAELIFRTGTSPDVRYIFKHALVRDAAYESLLRTKRQALHGRILEVMEAEHAAPEILAVHAREAGLKERAIDYYETAGTQAMTRPAFMEAMANLRQAVALAKTMGGDRAWQERELSLQIGVGQAAMGAIGYGAPQTSMEFRRARTLADAIGDTDKWFQAYYGVWVGHYVRAELPEALRIANDMMTTAVRDDDAVAVMFGHRLIGTSQTISGQPVVARGHFEQGIAMFDPERDRDLAFRTGQDVLVALQCYFAITLWILGFADQSRRVIDAALERANALGHPLTNCYALGHHVICDSLLRDPGRGGPLVEENIRFSEEHSIKIWLGISYGLRTWTLLEQGDHEAALTSSETSRPILATSGTSIFQPLMSGFELENLIALGRFAAAEAVVRQIDRRIDEGGERWFGAEIRRLEGDLCHAQGDFVAAEGCYRKALALAIKQQARAFELRSATSLAMLLAEQGDRAAARRTLESVYAWFTEGFDTRDLIAAKQLLDRL